MPTISRGINTVDLNPTFGSALNSLIAAVEAAGGHVNVESAFRTLADQQRIANNPALHPGRPVATPGTSLHEKGLAADLSGDARTMMLINQMAGKFGITGLKGDPGHFQLADLSKAAKGGTVQAGVGTTITQEAAKPKEFGIVDRLNALASMFNQGGHQPDQTTKGFDTAETTGTDTSSAITGQMNDVAPEQQVTTKITSPAGQTPAPTGVGGGSGGGAASGKFADLFNAAGARYGIDPRILSAVAKQESGYNPNARSGAGAVGLMQFMPGTAAGLHIDPMNPQQAVDGAARMLSGLVKQFGSVDKALAAYNAGAGAVQKYGGIPPYKETQNYVKSIMAMLG